MTELKSHPAADQFPLLVGEEFDALCADIKEHGLREAIVTHDGMILDGRNRYRACLRVEARIMTQEWDADGTPEAYVISKNIMRRHLTPSQRAMLISRFTTLGQSQRVDFVRQSTENGSPNSVLSMAEAAEIAGVNKATVSQAKIIRERGDSEQVAAVERGDRSILAVYEEVKGVTEEQKKKRTTDGDKKRAQTRAQMSKYWKQLKEGLEALGTLPEPSDLLTAIPAQQKDFVERRVPAALNWLTQFQEDWNGRDDNADD